jgi:hypothetical protein
MVNRTLTTRQLSFGKDFRDPIPLSRGVRSVICSP